MGVSVASTETIPLFMETKIIAKVNNIAIIASNEPEKFVPIKPICDILGVDVDSQRI
mgnify:CR=1 FL=1